MKKILLIILIILLIGFIIRFVLGGPEDSWICQDNQWIKHGNPRDPAPTSGCSIPMVGGDRDEHGCIGSAGYSWCQTKSKCLRVWEESCN